jgi:hypothetical protein
MRFFAFLLVVGFCQVSLAQSAQEYAVELNRSRVFQHDRGFRGAEVIYRSSGTATEADAAALVDGKPSAVGVCLSRRDYRDRLCRECLRRSRGGLRKSGGQSLAAWIASRWPNVSVVEQPQGR